MATLGRRLTAVGLVVAILAAGIVIGVVLERRWLDDESEARKPRRGGPRGFARGFAHFRERLSLSEEQSAEVEKILDEMRQAGCEPDGFSYSILINMCARSRDWKTAVSLLREMPGAGVQPNVISYSAAISACEKAGQWEKALSLLREMPDAGVQPDVHSYSAAI